MTARFRPVIMAAVVAGALYSQGFMPTIQALSPTSAVAGTPGLIISVTGLNFQSNTTVFWNGIPLATRLASAGVLTVTVPSWLLTSVGVASIAAINNPGNTSSNIVQFQITSQVQIVTSEVPSATVGLPYTAPLTASGGAAPYQWTLAGPAPPGLTLSTAGVLSGTPTSAGRFSFTIQATDAAGRSASGSISMSVANPALSISNPALPPATVGDSYRETLTPAGGTAPLRWTASGLPDGLRLDPDSGVIGGVPLAAGSSSVTVQLSDAAQRTASRTLTLTVNPAALVIVTVPPLFNGTTGMAYAQTLSASGGVLPYRWSLSAGETGGLTIDPASGVLRGTPQSPGTFSFTVQVTDSGGRTASRTYSVAIDRPALIIPTASLPAGSVGAPYSQNLSVTGGTAPYIWVVLSGSIPGVSLTPAGVFTGTPTQAGTFQVTVSARDSAAATASRSFSVSISAPPLRISSATVLPDITFNEEFSAAITASGGSPPYVWSANGLPEGLSVDAITGVISGTPAAAGPLFFTVRVTDSQLATSVELFRLRVNLPPVPMVQVQGLPETADAAKQFGVRVSLASPFAAPISGQATLSFSPDSGAGDGTIQFASGGRTANFSIPVGSAEAVSSVPLALQTGTVAGTLMVSVRLTAGGIDVTPSPAPVATVRIERAAPVIQSARMVRTSNGMSIDITGYSTTREVTQVSVTFAASGDQTLQNSTVTVPVEAVFNAWYQEPASSRYGSQFFFSQPFTVTGNADAVTARSVTLVNRAGSATAEIQR